MTWVIRHVLKTEGMDDALDEGVVNFWTDAVQRGVEFKVLTPRELEVEAVGLRTV
jgi:hypothetical protein